MKTDEEFMKIMTNIVYPTFGEEQTQPVDYVSGFEDLEESDDEIPVQDQVWHYHIPTLSSAQGSQEGTEVLT